MILGSTPAALRSAGGQERLSVQDDDSTSLLERLLTELRIMTLHFSVMTDNKFTKQDTE
jgi:hypothetical protein